jgi:bacteriocin-like protein
MKSFMIHTLVVAVALGTASMAASAELFPVTPAEKLDSPIATAATSAAPLHALSRLDASKLTEQEMTDQELKTIEGGASNSEIANGLYGALTNIGLHDFAEGMWRGYCGC